MLNILKCTLQMVKIVKCLCIFYNHLKPTSHSYSRPVLHFSHFVPFISPKWSSITGFRLPLILGSGVLCSPYTSSGTPGTFLFPRLCASFKTKFLGLLRKPLLMSLFRVLSILKLCCNKGSEVGQGVRMACEMNPRTEWQGGLNGRDFHPEYHSVGQDI